MNRKQGRHVFSSSEANKCRKSTPCHNNTSTCIVPYSQSIRNYSGGKLHEISWWHLKRKEVTSCREILVIINRGAELDAKRYFGCTPCPALQIGTFCLRGGRTTNLFWRMRKYLSVTLDQALLRGLTAPCGWPLTTLTDGCGRLLLPVSTANSEATLWHTSTSLQYCLKLIHWRSDIYSWCQAE